MCIITGLITGITAAATAISTAASAVGGILAMPLGVAFGAGAGTAAAVGGLGSITIGGALAGVGIATTAAISLGAMYQSSRASAEMQRQQAEAIRKLQENTGTPEVSKVTAGLQDNSRKARTLSSLRIGMLPQAQDKEQITNNVYGVDTNLVASSTQNMTGLNIAA